MKVFNFLLPGCLYVFNIFYKSFTTNYKLKKVEVLDRDRSYLKNKKTVKFEIAPFVAH